ncbi:MAG TPA: response regulator [Anaeromyxobacteraceae bacterium]|nr:response regulator [Anaeromyxobacteraceae bacterium]
MKILICCENEIVRDAVSLALSAAGHQAVASEPFQLVGNLTGALALVVDAGRGRQAIALLRDRGFTGRALVTGVMSQEELGRLAEELDADGALALDPLDTLAERFAASVGRRRRVLIVDDSEIVARLLEEELRGKGFEIRYAPDAETATTLILKRESRPDLILLDINMPRVNGVQFCRFVKKNERFRGIKVILCSGAAKETVQSLAADCGADGYVFKDELLGRWVAEQAG